MLTSFGFEVGWGWPGWLVPDSSSISLASASIT
jgi:hypothetical protein